MPDELAVRRDQRAEKIEDAARTLVGAMEAIFGYDWDFTREQMQDLRYLVADGGTFLEPGVSDESNNWGCRGGFLAAYRELADLLEPQRRRARRSGAP
jgi:hypothetical protein